MLFEKGQLHTTRWKNAKINFKTAEEFQARFEHFQELKPCFAFLVNLFSVNVFGDGCPVHLPFVTHLTAAEIKLAEMQKKLALKKL